MVQQRKRNRYCTGMDKDKRQNSVIKTKENLAVFFIQMKDRQLKKVERDILRDKTGFRGVKVTIFIENYFQLM